MNQSDRSSNLLRLRRLFYLVRPSEAMHGPPEAVPNYVVEAIPYFLLMIVVEGAILARKRGPYTGISVADSISSISAGIVSQLPLLFFRSAEVAAFLWVHDHLRVLDLPGDSALVWLLGMLGVDFCYYWVHRASHEVSLFWSGHQVHHSSQRYNLTTALRQGSLQRYFSWMFYLPLALVLPPSFFVVHIQFNLLYQFWIHTEVVGKLGPLEYVLNTPSHHRVHHGRNRYCIDKNYGGTLIVFDRLFGTFEEEDEKVVYGLVTTLETWNPFEVQVCHLRYVLRAFCEAQGVSNRLKAFFYGPGWVPGTPRLGDDSKIPDPESPVVFYGQRLGPKVVVYCLVNFVLANLAYVWLATAKPPMRVLIMVTRAVLATLVQVGRILDGRRVFGSECLRVAFVVAVASGLLSDPSLRT